MSNVALTKEQFETKWQAAQTSPVTIPPAEAVDTTKWDFSLTSVLDRFLVIEDKFLSQGKVNKADHDDLLSKINALKSVLARINEKDLMAAETADRFKSGAGPKAAG